MTTNALTTTNASFVRSHGKAPRGRASWALQQTKTRDAFGGDLVGEIFWAPSNLTPAQAVKALKESGATGLWAFLP